MPRSWFRHEANLRNDPAIRALCDEFGPLGDLAFRRLLEVRCQEDREVEATPDELAQMLGLRPDWDLDVGAWLHAAAKAGLIKLSSGPRNRRRISIRSWDRYQKAWERPDAAAERKRRSRASVSRVTSQSGECDVTEASQPYATARNDTKRSSTDTATDAAAAADVHREPRPLAGLLALGVQRETAKALIRTHGRDRVVEQLRWLPQRPAVKHPAAAIVTAIRDGWEPPENAPATPRGPSAEDTRAYLETLGSGARASPEAAQAAMREIRDRLDGRERGS